MKNLLDRLYTAGLSEEQAQKTLEVIAHWLEEEYPVLSTLAKNTILREEMDHANNAE